MPFLKINLIKPQEYSINHIITNRIIILSNQHVNLFIFRYDTITDQWTFIKPLHSPRSALAAVSFKCGRVLALGGYNGVDFVSTIEMLDPNTGEWIVIGNMTSERSGHAAAMTIDFVH